MGVFKCASSITVCLHTDHPNGSAVKVQVGKHGAAWGKSSISKELQQKKVSKRWRHAVGLRCFCSRGAVRRRRTEPFALAGVWSLVFLWPPLPLPLVFHSFSLNTVTSLTILEQPEKYPHIHDALDRSGPPPVPVGRWSLSLVLRGKRHLHKGGTAFFFFFSRHDGSVCESTVLCMYRTLRR